MRPDHVTSLNRVRSLSGALAVALSAGGAAGCSGEAPAGREENLGITRQALTTNAYAFAWSSQLTGTFTAPPAFASASNVQIISGTNGYYYNVQFPGLGSVAQSGNGGNVQVTAYGGGNANCNILSGPGGDGNGALEVNVGCFGPSGASTSSQFTINYVSRSDTPGVQGGYARAHFETSSVQRAWNSTGQPITFQRSGVGVYSITFAGQAISGGTAEVTADQAPDPELPPRYCEVQSWDTQTVNVRCFTTGGNGPGGGPKLPRGPVDSDFDVIFSEGLPNGTGYFAPGSPNGTPSFTYAWADQPSAASYQPDLFYQKGEIPVPGCCVTTTSPPVTVTRSKRGVYSVNFPQMPFSTDPNNGFYKSNVKVTAYGTAGEYCKVGGWSGTTSNASATVNCFSASGSAADALYTVTYSSTLFLIP